MNVRANVSHVEPPGTTLLSASQMYPTFQSSGFQCGSGSYSVETLPKPTEMIA